MLLERKAYIAQEVQVLPLRLYVTWTGYFCLGFSVFSKSGNVKMAISVHSWTEKQAIISAPADYHVLLLSRGHTFKLIIVQVFRH